MFSHSIYFYFWTNTFAKWHHAVSIRCRKSTVFKHAVCLSFSLNANVSGNLIFTSRVPTARKRKCWTEAVCHMYCACCDLHTNHASPRHRSITNPCHVWIWQLWMTYSGVEAINAHYGVSYAVITGVEKSCHRKEYKIYNNTWEIKK